MSALNIFLGKIQYAAAQGWSESYYLKGTTLAAAKVNLNALVTARLPMLHSSIDIDYANVSQLGVNRDSYIVINGPQAGTDTITADAPNRLSDAILLRQESLGGRICNRYMHGVPDNAVLNNSYVATGNAAWDALLTAYITALKANSGFLKKVNPADPTTWLIEDWGQVVSRGLTSHKVGRPFDLRPGRRPTA
jgi:hypothetical protein